MGLPSSRDKALTTAATIAVTTKHEGLETTEADYHSLQTKPMQCNRNSQARSNQAEFEPKETEEEFEKISWPSLPEAVTVHELLEETHSHTDLSDLKKSHSWRMFYDEREEGTFPPA